MILLIDNYDSFSGNLLDYLRQCGAEVVLKQNDAIHLDEIENYQGIVLSPGPGRPEEAGNLMALLARAVDCKIPTLGICLGHQAIGLHFGAKLIKGQVPVHGKTALVHFTDQPDPLLDNLPDPFEVMRYHSLVLDQLEVTDLKVTGMTEKGVTMMIRHSELPISGFQFHPESIGTPCGLQLIENWLKYVKSTAVR